VSPGHLSICLSVHPLKPILHEAFFSSFAGAISTKLGASVDHVCAHC